jgi:hypothetical protein
MPELSALSVVPVQSATIVQSDRAALAEAGAVRPCGIRFPPSGCDR